MKQRNLGCALTAAVVLLGMVAAGFVWGPRVLEMLAGSTAPEEGSAYVINDTTSAEETARRRAQEQAHLATYGWIDREGGIAHIPIEQAMRLVAEQGLPVRAAVDDGTTEVDAGAEDLASAVATPDAPLDLSNVNYTEHVLPIFEQHCAECHGAEDPEEGLELTRYRTAMIGSQHGRVIEPGDPDGSYLVELILRGAMPKQGDPLSAAEIELIIAWIRAGAPEN